jgi:hypothetical protein
MIRLISLNLASQNKNSYNYLILQKILEDESETRKPKLIGIKI